MRAKRHRVRSCMAGLLVAGLVPATSGWSADRKSVPAAATSPAMASERSSVKPAAERTIQGRAVGSAAETRTTGAATKSSGKPMGPRIPEHLRKALEAQIAARIDRDVASQKDLRREAVALLETFVKEESPTAREMPEALMRLGELYWESERDPLLSPFPHWEKPPTPHPAPAPPPPL